MIYKEILADQKENIGFLELKDGVKIQVGSESFAGYLPLPILKENLVDIVKKEITDIPLEYFIEGMVFTISLGEATEYKATYLKFLEEFTKDLKGYTFKKALEYLNAEDYAKGVTYLNLLVEEGLGDARVYFALGQGLENLDISTLSQDHKTRYAVEIMNTYERVLNLDSTFSLAYYKLGYMYGEFGQYLKAKLSFEKVIALDKNEFRIQEVRDKIQEIESEILKEEALVEINGGNYQEALKKLLAVNLEKRDDLYYYHLSLTYTSLKELDAAYDAISKAIEIEDLAAYHNQLAIIYQNYGDLETARKEIEETIDRFGPDYFLNFNLATIQYNQGDLEAAVGNFEIAYEINPTDELLDIIRQLKSPMIN